MTRPVVAASPVYHHADDRVRLHALLTALDASSVALQRGRETKHDVARSMEAASGPQLLRGWGK